MARSLLLGAYLLFSNRAMGYADRKLAERLAAGKEDPARLDERRGIASAPRPNGPLIWLHAASVGESVSVLEMIRRMGDERPDLSFLITSGTVTSAEVLANRLPPRAIHQYVPLDVRPWIRRFLDHWRPNVLVLAEGEIWPALLYEAKVRDLPVALINARMTSEAHGQWSRWARGAARQVLAKIDRVQAQDDTTAQRLLSLGLPADRLEVTGTLKEGSKALPHNEPERVDLANALAGRPCWLAASTHEGEEVGAAEAHAHAQRSWQKLLLIIAPRHPDRADEIVSGLRLDGWRVAQRSKDDPIALDTQIYVADTIGEMGLWYRLCPVSFMGGSLVPVGGHNPFEPAALGSAILHGPHVKNFADIYARLTEAAAARQVQDWADLGTTLAHVLEPDEAAKMAHAAWEVCSSGADVTERAMDLLFALLDGVE
ncbi:3-deoxy-D-manno-octulosonic acid transferase [Jannaschia pagri]|uniref:3-deoxy-D-manno-octulosonic acid transferase n=1 Tax=Jannaschia pagri TaxID=2829797 RepID=A0ABQ4NPX3_9RHOB|nr:MULTISPECIES: 3-deoxy-D-manno-octulosonic acid transferase [unclassified Jannaschia]GIT92682.1 3-deoxy-D-manno-octulosonic acid transferase [Jannaschia sp. AI_61]GIT96458.1 3-deoxy-D-manno-octulosonic acid transferase [Jannaschia sp. AI_62]